MYIFWYMFFASQKPYTITNIHTRKEGRKRKKSNLLHRGDKKKTRSWTWGLLRPQETQSFRSDEVMPWNTQHTSSPLWDVLTSPGDGDDVFPRTAGVILVGEHPILTGELLHWLLDALWNHTQIMWYVCTSWNGTNLCAVIWGYINKTEWVTSF